MLLQGHKGTITKGSWHVDEAPHAAPPIMTLQLQGGLDRVLITRFRTTPGACQRELVLYFPSGLELELRSL